MTKAVKVPKRRSGILSSFLGTSDGKKRVSHKHDILGSMIKSGNSFDANKDAIATAAIFELTVLWSETHFKVKLDRRVTTSKCRR